MPEFPGGIDSLFQFISRNFRMTEEVTQDLGEGRVTIRFVITEKGDITNVVVLRGFGPSYNKEAVRVVKMMPRWTPGRQNGRNVPVYYTLPFIHKFNK